MAEKGAGPFTSPDLVGLQWVSFLSRERVWIPAFAGNTAEVWGDMG